MRDPREVVLSGTKSGKEREGKIHRGGRACDIVSQSRCAPSSSYLSLNEHALNDLVQLHFATWVQGLLFLQAHSKFHDKWHPYSPGYHGSRLDQEDFESTLDGRFRDEALRMKKLLFSIMMSKFHEGPYMLLEPRALKIAGL